MDLPVDLRTLYLVGAAASAICAVSLLGARRTHAPSAPALIWGACSQLLVSLSLLISALPATQPGTSLQILADAGGTAGLVMLYESVRRLCLLPPRPHLAVGVVITLVGLHMALSGLSAPVDELYPQIGSVIQGGFAALMLPVLGRRLALDPRGPMTAAIALAGFLVFAHLFRLSWVGVFSGAGLTGPGFSGSVIESLLAALCSLSPLMHALVTISCVNGRLAGELRRAASTDELTGLSTRRDLFTSARASLLTQRHRTALLMIDIDWFKQVNDRHGHKVGDRVLAHFAAVLRDALPGCDLVARYGGEEFCALIERDSEALVHQEALALCERVRAHPFQAENLRIPLTVSIGVAQGREAATIEELFAMADRRVYLAKAMGRDRVVDRRSARPAPGAEPTRSDEPRRAHPASERPTLAEAGLPGRG